MAVFKAKNQGIMEGRGMFKGNEKVEEGSQRKGIYCKLGPYFLWLNL